MSASKARLQEHVNYLVEQRARLEDDVVFLLQALMDISADRPEIELPEIGNDRFPERIWRRITC